MRKKGMKIMENNRKRAVIKTLTALLLILAMIFTMLPDGVRAAAEKPDTLKKTLYVGQTQQLELKNYTKTVSWTSSNTAVASVSSSGLVMALKKGSAVISATTAKGNTYSCKIKVKNPYVSPKSVTLKVGEKKQLSVVGANAVSWSSKAKKRAKVSNTGLVTAVKASDKAVTIKVKCDNGKTYKCKVTVVAADASDTPGNDDDPGSRDDPADPVEYYGIRTKKEKTPYQSEIRFDTPVTTVEQLAQYCREGLRSGAEKIIFKVHKDYAEDWLNTFAKLFCDYSVLAGYSNKYGASYTVPGSASEKYSTVTITPIYKDGWKAVVLLQHTDYEADDNVKKLLKIAQGIVDDAVADSSDLKTQLLYINDRICDMAEYDYDDAKRETSVVIEKDGVKKTVPAHDATGVLVNGKGVCESYVSAYQLCLEILGVENYVMTNAKGGHAWNRVKVDGKWYHTDVTWNDSDDYKNAFFLLDDSKFFSETERTGNDKDYHKWYTSYLPE